MESFAVRTVECYDGPMLFDLVMQHTLNHPVRTLEASHDRSAVNQRLLTRGLPTTSDDARKQ